MKRVVMVLVLLAPGLAGAEIYKCPKPGGGVGFSDRPCGGAAESPDNAIRVDPPAAPDVARKRQSDAERERDLQEAERYRVVELPAIRAQAAELMASADPQQQAIGREMMWQAHEAEKAYEQLRKAHEARKETERRYGDALRQIRGY